MRIKLATAKVRAWGIESRGIVDSDHVGYQYNGFLLEHEGDVCIYYLKLVLKFFSLSCSCFVSQMLQLPPSSVECEVVELRQVRISEPEENVG